MEILCEIKMGLSSIYGISVILVLISYFLASGRYKSITGIFQIWKNRSI